jgi:asparagine synthase (glutamine-hydrolysing)
MPGIFGLVNCAPRMDLSADLAAMADQLRHHSWYQESRHIDNCGGIALGRITLGFVNRAKQPASSEDHSLLAMMEGEVYDYAERRRELSAAGHTFLTDSHAELLVHGYESKGKAFFSDLNGSFVAAIWDVRSRRLVLVNDRFGMKPLYYAKLPGRLLFASEIKALLTNHDVPRKPDPRGIAQFFGFGQLLGEDTMLAAVRHMPAGGWFIYDAASDSLTQESHWRLETTSASQEESETNLLDRIDVAFKRAVDRRAAGTGHLGLSLSGGLDARSILAVLDPGTPITTVCLGVEGSMDHNSAQQMANLFGCRHRNFYLTTQFLSNFEEHLRWLVHVTDGHYQSQCVTVPTLPVYRELGIEVLLRGHAGELLHMNKAYSYSLDRDALGIRDGNLLEEWLYQHLGAFVSTSGAGPLFAKSYTSMESLARESLRACLAQSAHLEPPAHRVWHLFLTQRLRRETALSMVEFGSQVETRLPFLDNELIDLLFSVPPQLKIGDKIQAHILRRRRPAFLKVINANTGAPMGAGPLRSMAAKVRLKVLAKLGVRGYQPYEKLGRWLREELRPLVCRLLLSDRCLDRGVFDPQTVRAVVDGHLAGRRNHTFLLMAMMIFELGQREFIDGDSYSAADGQGSAKESSMALATPAAGSEAKC